MILEFHRMIFQGTASIIVSRPALILISCLLISLIVSMGSVCIRFKDNFRTGYSEPDAPSLAEHLAYRSFYNLTTAPYLIGLLGECEEGDSMLHPDVFKLMLKDKDLGLSTIIPNDEPTDQRHTLKDYLVFSSEAHFNAIEESINYPNENIQIGYPISTVFSQRLSMRRIMYGVKNDTVKILWYVMVFQPESAEILAKIKSAELAWYQRLEKHESSLLRLHFFGDELVDNEILIGSVSTIPYLIIGGTLMMIVVFSALTRYNQSFISTIGLLFWTAMCPILAGIMAIAIFSLRGVPINCMMFITPFLVLGVGVDDAFLMIHNWFHSKEVDGSCRLSTMLVEVGPSVTLTSLTNVVAFLIGGIMSPPDVRSFCYCTAVALTFGWLLQFFFFTPILLRFHNCSFDLPTFSSKIPETSAYIRYAKFLRCNWVRITSIIMMILYWSAGVYFALQMRSNFAPEKTFDTHSFLATSFDIKDRIGKDHEIIDILINEVPPTVSDLFRDLKQIHSIQYLCDNFTTWIEDYAMQYPTRDDNIQQFFANLPQFLDENPDWIRSVFFEWNSNGSLKVQRFALEICVKGFGSWRERAIMAEDLRARLPNGFTLYMYDSNVFDVILSTRRCTTKSVLTTIVCLTLLCALFTPCMKAISLAVLSVISITIGVLGGLSAWGADLDIIVMVNIVMAVGLTVDYTAHISYHCFTSDPTLSGDERIAHSIRAVAFPTVQAALTTLVCVFPLFFYSVYMYVTFTKTIILCSVIGLIHAIYVVPLFYSMIISSS